MKLKLWLVGSYLLAEGREAGEHWDKADKLRAQRWDKKNVHPSAIIVTAVTETQHTTSKHKQYIHTHNRFMALWILSGTTWVCWYQKKHSSTHTHRGHQSSLSAVSIYYDPWH